MRPFLHSILLFLFLFSCNKNKVNPQNYRISSIVSIGAFELNDNDVIIKYDKKNLISEITHLSMFDESIIVKGQVVNKQSSKLYKYYYDSNSKLTKIEKLNSINIIEKVLEISTIANNTQLLKIYEKPQNTNKLELQFEVNAVFSGNNLVSLTYKKSATNTLTTFHELWKLSYDSNNNLVKVVNKVNIGSEQTQYLLSSYDTQIENPVYKIKDFWYAMLLNNLSVIHIEGVDDYAYHYADYFSKNVPKSIRNEMANVETHKIFYKKENSGRIIEKNYYEIDSNLSKYSASTFFTYENY